MVVNWYIVAFWPSVRTATMQLVRQNLLMQYDLVYGHINRSNIINFLSKTHT